MESRGKSAANPLAGAGDTTPDSVAMEAQEVTDFGIAVARHVHEEGDATACGESGQGSAGRAKGLAPHHLLQYGLGIGGSADWVRRLTAHSDIPPLPCDAGVDGDAVEPGMERCYVTEGVSVLPGLHEGVLSDLLRDVEPTCTVESDSHQGAAIALDHVPEECLVPCFHPDAVPSV